jgi:hypothetical protein
MTGFVVKTYKNVQKTYKRSLTYVRTVRTYAYARTVQPWLSDPRAHAHRRHEAHEAAQAGTRLQGHGLRATHPAAVARSSRWERE